MSKSYRENQPIRRPKCMEELRRYQKGSISRRQFLAVTCLVLERAGKAGALPGRRPSRAWSAEDIGDR
ncbi:MAG: spermidine/putrescine ABC transporter substrate-binding protein, partial [Alphaproteobacteria bacterium]